MKGNRKEKTVVIKNPKINPSKLTCWWKKKVISKFATKKETSREEVFVEERRVPRNKKLNEKLSGLWLNVPNRKSIKKEIRNR